MKKMDLSNNNSNEKNQEIKIKTNLQSIKSNFILKKIHSYLKQSKSLGIIRYNKKLQKRLNFTFKNYKDFSEIFTPIEIEILPFKNRFGKFINIEKAEDEPYFHIYFNFGVRERKRSYFNNREIIIKIKIIIDYQVKSFENLFANCKCIKSINFIKFYRNNIINMSGMFNKCSLLELSNFNTKIEGNMNGMFFGCSKEVQMKIKEKYKNINDDAFNFD